MQVEEEEEKEEDGCKIFFLSGGTKGVGTSGWLRFIETIDGVGMAPQTPPTTHQMAQEGEGEGDITV